MTASERECRQAWQLADIYDAVKTAKALREAVWASEVSLWSEFLRERLRPYPIALDGEVIGWPARLRSGWLNQFDT